MLSILISVIEIMQPKKFSLITALILTSSLSLTVATPAGAISNETLRFFATNGIYYYDPSSDECIVPTGSYSGEASAGLSATQAAFVDTYHSIAEQLSIEYGIPWETVMAQGILESAAGTSYFAVNRNNFFGIGAFDSNPNNAFSYATPSEGWRGYYENIVKTSVYRANGVFVQPTVTDPYAYLRAIKAAGYATDPQYVPKVSQLIAAIEVRAKQQGWKSSAELAAAHPEMLANAAINASGGSSAGSTTSSSSDICITTGNGDINATAIELSWPERGHDPWNDPKPAYTTALAATGVNRLGDSCSMNGNSCDAFVATVLRYSGVDPDVPCCGAQNMLNYFLSHPEKYEEIPNIGNSSNMQPGDIRSSSGHVEIYVQLTDGSYAIASASHCNRTADHGIGYYADSSYHIFRAK